MLGEEDALVKDLNTTKDPKEYNEKINAIKYVRECICQKVTTNAEVNHLKYLNKSVNKVPAPQQGLVSPISKDKLIEIFKDFLKDRINDIENNDGYWYDGSRVGLIYFNLNYTSLGVSSIIGSCLCYDDDEFIGYDIYNTYSDTPDYVNIRIRKDYVEFIDDSKFEDFSKEEMRRLYEMIKNVISSKSSTPTSRKKHRLFISQAFTGKDDAKIMVQRANLYQLFCFYKHLKPEDVELIEQHLPDDPYDTEKNFRNEKYQELYRFCRSVGMLGKATDVIVYGDISNSRGAKLEKEICDKYNIGIIDNSDLIEFCKNSNDTKVIDLFEKLYPKEFDKLHDTTDGFTEDDDK